MKSNSQPKKLAMKPNSQPTKPAHKPSQATTQSMKTPLQPIKPHPQPKKVTLPPQSNTPSQIAKNSQGNSNKNKDGGSGCRLTRSGRYVKQAPIQEEDSDTHDAYESAEDELYKPPKVVGDNLYSSDSDSETDNRKSGARKDIKSEGREKYRPPKTRLGDKEIKTDDSSYEGSEDEQSSDSDLDEDDNDLEAIGLFSGVVMKKKNCTKCIAGQPIWLLTWESAHALVGMPCMHAISAIQDKNDKRTEEYCHDWLKIEAYRRTYYFNVNPIKGQDLWKKHHILLQSHPPFKPKLGRPMKKRRRENDEQPTGSKTKMKRKYNPIRYMYYIEIGHNKRGCAKKKALDAEKNARQMQLQLAVIAPAADGADLEVNVVPPPTEIDISQSESIPPTQATQQDEVIARPPKLQVIKEKARARSSSKPTAVALVAISAETIKWTSSVTAKKLANFMTFVPTPGFKHPRKNDKPL
ncbi:hypothetical protein Ahy_B05g077151 [Arachis hypogaea]|uniref:Zinc finger PMZ-type domain-containing protein n=1 Tax=Arachis hypogaea TaxID=3818 RepID=A0A444Z4E8_ARAHY|nr:hypothetical protein Ahy_B05g077151 [Arachis hypogaea]